MADITPIQAELKLPVGRLSYPSLNPEKPRYNDQGDYHEWIINLLFDPQAKDYLAFRAKYDAMRAEFVKRYRIEPKTEPRFIVLDKWANAEKTKLQDILLVDMIKLKVSQKKEGRERDFEAPMLLGADGGPAHHQDFYPGCFVRGVINIREYNHANAKGVSISRGLSADLRAVQFVRDGDSLGTPKRDYAAYLAEADPDEVDPAAIAAAYPV